MALDRYCSVGKMGMESEIFLRDETTDALLPGWSRGV